VGLKDVLALMVNGPTVSLVHFSCEVITTALHCCIFHIDVAEVAFNRCVTTNEDKKDHGNEVHATSDALKVDFNYEFLEDFPDKHSPDR